MRPIARPLLLIASLIGASLLLPACGDDKGDRSKIGEPVAGRLGTDAKGRRGRGPVAIGYPRIRMHTPVAVGEARGQCTGSGEMPSSSNLAEIKAAILCLHNAERRSRGLPPLRLNDRLALAAQDHASDMVRSGYFAHQSRRGTTFIARIKRRGYRGSNVGENIAAAGDGDLAKPAAIVRDWMTSSGHRANILNPRFNEIGIGVFPAFPGEDAGSEGGTYVTNFGASSRR